MEEEKITTPTDLLMLLKKLISKDNKVEENDKTA